MKALLCVLVLARAFAQDQNAASTPDEPVPAVAQDQPPPAATSPQAPAVHDADRPPAGPSGESANRSVIKAKPGEQIIKRKDYSDESGYLHPFRRIGAYVFYDQKAL